MNTVNTDSKTKMIIAFTLKARKVLQALHPQVQLLEYHYKTGRPIRRHTLDRYFNTSKQYLLKAGEYIHSAHTIASSDYELNQKFLMITKQYTEIWSQYNHALLEITASLAVLHF
jgi:hypothetical protein